MVTEDNLSSSKEENGAKKPSVLLAYHFYAPDDVVSAVHYTQFAEELAKRDWDVTVLTSNRYCRYPEKKIALKR